MVQICEGVKTKGDFLTENVEKYKDMYMRTKNDFVRIMTVRLAACVCPRLALADLSVGVL